MYPNGGLARDWAGERISAVDNNLNVPMLSVLIMRAQTGNVECSHNEGADGQC